MLLIDHHQAKPVEFHFFFDQRVSPDDQLRLTPINQPPRVALPVLVE